MLTEGTNDSIPKEDSAKNFRIEYANLVKIGEVPCSPMCKPVGSCKIEGINPGEEFFGIYDLHRRGGYAVPDLGAIYMVIEPPTTQGDVKTATIDAIFEQAPKRKGKWKDVTIAISFPKTMRDNIISSVVGLGTVYGGGFVINNTVPLETDITSKEVTISGNAYPYQIRNLIRALVTTGRCINYKASVK